MCWKERKSMGRNRMERKRMIRNRVICRLKWDRRDWNGKGWKGEGMHGNGRERNGTGRENGKRGWKRGHRKERQWNGMREEEREGMGWESMEGKEEKCDGRLQNEFEREREERNGMGREGRLWRKRWGGTEHAWVRRKAQDGTVWEGIYRKGWKEIGWDRRICREGRDKGE